MNDSIIYLFKVSAGIGIILLPYYFLSRNDPNLTAKRLYLLLGLFSAWIFPLITFRKPELLINLAPIVFIDPNGTDSLPVNLSDSGSRAGITINWIQVLIIVYLTGMALMLLRNIFQILKMKFSWQKLKGKNGIAFTESDQVFTIFSKIFIPRKLQDTQDLDNILLHERAHVQQLHFFDLILMELTLLLTWFNPFSWLISRMIKENHEHLADRQVLSVGVNPAHYRAQLLNHTLGVNVFRLGNQFNHSLTIKRFKMMKKPTKSPLGIIKIAMLIPAVVVTLGLTIGMTPQERSIKGKVPLADTSKHLVYVLDGEVVKDIKQFDFNSFKTITVYSDPDREICKKFNATDGLMLITTRSRVGTTIGLDEKIMLTPQEAKTLSMDNEKPPKGGPVFSTAEVMPMFPDGEAALKTYIYSHLEYPESAKKQGIGGEVFVQFQVTPLGKLEDMKVYRSTYQGFDKAALDVFKDMPDWNPGKQRGTPVTVQVVVPVKFNADKE